MRRPGLEWSTTGWSSLQAWYSDSDGLAFAWIRIQVENGGNSTKGHKNSEALIHPSHTQVSDQLRPPMEGLSQHVFLQCHSTHCLLESKLPSLSPNKMNKKWSFSLIPFNVVAWGLTQTQHISSGVEAVQIEFDFHQRNTNGMEMVCNHEHSMASSSYEVLSW